MISHAHRAIFFHIPKTAGTSIEQKLGLFEAPTRGAQDHRSLREIRPLSLLRHWRQLFMVPPGRGYRMLREMFGLAVRPGPHGPRASREEFATYYKFTVVRNPWARVYSWYRNLMRDSLLGVPPCDFATFLRKHVNEWAVRPQTYWITDFDGSIPLERIVRFENLIDEMREVLADLGFHDRTLPHFLQAEGGADYRAAYSDTLAKLIAERYRDEIQMFQYDF